jgi:hypothetical protein
LNDLDTIYYQDISKNNIIDIDSDNTFIINKKNIQDEIKKENIKKFIECFDIDKHKFKINIFSKTPVYFKKIFSYIYNGINEW